MKRFVVWFSALAIVVLVAISLAACGKTTTCYGTEPDGEVEILRPCPDGWKDGDNRKIGEDQFDFLEYDSKNHKMKKSGKRV
jgi:hypothetical protein